MTADARLLFVVSSDYGELSNALAVLKGYPFRARLLLPDRLLDVNRNDLPVPADRWATATDVLTHVEADEPDVVFLCSAYLFAFNGIVDLDELERLVGTLAASGRALATTDPFLGVLARRDPVTFRADHPQRAWLMEHFARVAALLDGIVHLYPVPFAVPGIPTASFFNPHAELTPQERAAARIRTRWLDLDPPRRRWVFVLSGEDWSRQVGRHGAGRFGRLVVDKLAETARARRQPVLIAPPAVVDALRSATALIEGIALLPYTSHAVFTALTVDAEHVFYWNVFSNSILFRVANHGAVSFFDAGHIAHSLPAVAAAGFDAYWRGLAPTYLDIEAPLDPAHLAALAADQDRAMDPMRPYYFSAPAPDALVTGLLSRRATR